MCSDNESPMPSHRKCKNITKVFPYNLENMIYIVSKRNKTKKEKKRLEHDRINEVSEENSSQAH